MRISSSAAAAILACAAGALVAGCGASDNAVYGGVNSADRSKYPDASIPDVRSAIHFFGKVSNQANPAAAPVVRAIVILSGQDRLCDSLARTPDYFKTAPQGFTALILTTPLGQVGDFAIGAVDTDASLLTSFTGGPIALLPAVGGDVSVTEFNTAGTAKGTFSLSVAASTSAYTIYGRFKTRSCGAIGGAYIPFSR
ncbi:MAG: hypothetical protein NVSMB23_24550 [Myxococcales bacterium]